MKHLFVLLISVSFSIFLNANTQEASKDLNTATNTIDVESVGNQSMLNDYFKQATALYKAPKKENTYKIFYKKVEAEGTDIPRVIARMYVPTKKENFVRAIRDCNNYGKFLPGQSKKDPTKCAPPNDQGNFEQTAVMDLPWPLDDLKYKTFVTPFNLQSGRMKESWENLKMDPQDDYGSTTVNKGSWTIANPSENDFYLQYEFLVVPSTSVPESIKGWLADAALEKIIEAMVNRSINDEWTSEDKTVIKYKKVKVDTFSNISK